MDSSEAVLDIIEAQGSANDQREQKCFPMNQINKGERSLSSRAFLESGGECMPLPSDVPEYLTNLKLSDLYNLPGESVPMTPEIFGAMRGGNREILDKLKSYGTPIPYFKNERGDSILHLAAAWGHIELVKAIVSECPYLILDPNSKGQLPLHVAARAGHLTVVEALVATVTFFSAKLSGEEERKRLNIYVLKDINRDTPLHLALKDLHRNAELLRYQKNIRPVLSSFHRFRACSFPDTSTRQRETAACLVKVNQRASFLANKDGVSPLYMAIEAGSLSLTNAMLDKTSNFTSQLEGRKSLVHAALKANTYFLDDILNENPGLVNERDEEGRTCLSVGASEGFYGAVCKVLDISTSNVYECDSDGSFPIHMAVEKGHMDIAEEILKRCPDSEYLLNRQGQNILHIAAKSGKAKSFLLDYVKKNDTKNHLIEEQDVDGNTPLHLATIHWRPRTLRKLAVFALTNPKVLNIQKKDGLRPIDIAKLNLQSNYIFRERMTLVVLLHIYTLEDFVWMPLNGMTLRSTSEQHRSGGDNKYKDQINILLLVAALAATVTFAAGFTMPGGFNSSDAKSDPKSGPNPGMAILAKDPSLSKFLLFDSLAMQCSVVTIVSLIWAQLGDPDIVQRALGLALPSLFFAVTWMFAAFVCGVMATIKQNKFLVEFITSTSLISYAVIVIIFAPYMVPQTYASFFLPILLWFVNEDDAEKHHTSGPGDSSIGSSSDDQVKNIHHTTL